MKALRANLGSKVQLDLAGLPQTVLDLFNSKNVLNISISPDPAGRRLRRRRVAQLWSDMIMNCHIILDTSLKTKKEHIAVMKKMRARFNDPTQNQPKQEESFPFAYVESHEVSSTQPIVFGFLDMIGDCCKENGCKENGHDNRFSPAKTVVKRDTVVIGADNRVKRTADGSLAKPGRHVPVTLDNAMNMQVEVKPLFRESQSIEKLDHESKHQVVGHLAKYNYQGLKFCGTGTSTCATGVTVNPAYIIVYNLDLKLEEYCDKETPVAKLKLAASVKLPLMTRKCFETWIKKSDAVKKSNQSACKKSKR